MFLESLNLNGRGLKEEHESPSTVTFFDSSSSDRRDVSPNRDLRLLCISACPRRTGASWICSSSRKLQFPPLYNGSFVRSASNRPRKFRFTVVILRLVSDRRIASLGRIENDQPPAVSCGISCRRLQRKQTKVNRVSSNFQTATDWHLSFNRFRQLFRQARGMRSCVYVHPDWRLPHALGGRFVPNKQIKYAGWT